MVILRILTMKIQFSQTSHRINILILILGCNSIPGTKKKQNFMQIQTWNTGVQVFQAFPRIELYG